MLIMGEKLLVHLSCNTVAELSVNNSQLVKVKYMPVETRLDTAYSHTLTKSQL